MAIQTFFIAKLTGKLLLSPSLQACSYARLAKRPSFPLAGIRIKNELNHLGWRRSVDLCCQQLPKDK